MNWHEWHDVRTLEGLDAVAPNKRRKFKLNENGVPSVADLYHHQGRSGKDVKQILIMALLLISESGLIC